MLSHLSIEEQMAVVAEALATCSVVKFDAKDQVLWKLSRLEMIQAQLEFWFSNENLEVDKYLRLQVESNEEGSGLVLPARCVVHAHFWSANTYPLYNGLLPELYTT